MIVVDTTMLIDLLRGDDACLRWWSAVEDPIVAATARLLGASVSTANVRNFPMFAGLQPPY